MNMNDNERSQCPTCRSNRRDWDRSPTSNDYNWHRYRRDLATFRCPNVWHLLSPDTTGMTPQVDSPGSEA